MRGTQQENISKEIGEVVIKKLGADVEFEFEVSKVVLSLACLLIWLSSLYHFRISGNCAQNQLAADVANCEIYTII